MLSSKRHIQAFKSAKPRSVLTRAGLVIGVLFTSYASYVPQSAYACFSCADGIDAAKGDIWREARDELTDKVDERFKWLQSYILENIWERSVLPNMMLSAEQFSAIAMQQAMAVGMFIDAEIQMDTQRLLQEIRANTHKKYHPSTGMCEFGSLMKSIAATELKGEFQATVLSHRSQDRQLGQTDTVGATGGILDRFSRLEQFKNKYCNVMNRNTALKDFCDSDVHWDDSGFLSHKRGQTSKDIDYFSLVNFPKTMNIDFTNTEIVLDANDNNFADAEDINNEDEEHVLAMAANLYGYVNFARFPSRLLEEKADQGVTDAQRVYLDMRSIVAKRSVAENSLYAIAALKAKGNRVEAASPSGGGGGGGPTPPPTTEPMSARPYMVHVLTELGGTTPDQALQILGEDPSYYAQMEILTKKLYQNPDFYTNLYDKPANVERKATALQAIKLMQKFDMLESYLRNEASTSILLELAVVDLQKEVEEQIRSIRTSGE